MEKTGQIIMEDFVSSLRTSVITCAYTHVREDWKEIDYVPDYNKFYFIEDGEGWLRIGGAEYWPKPGQLFLMPEGVLQSYSTISRSTFQKYWCHFSLKLGNINFLDLPGLPRYIDVKDTGRMRALFSRLIDAHASTTLSSRLREKAILLEIVSDYLETAGVSELEFARVNPLQQINRVLTYIQEHISEDLPMEELSRHFFYTPNYLTRTFKKYMGMTPAQYINKTRLDQAKLLLRTTSLQVSEVAMRVGCPDMGYFSKRFKSYTGFSPTDYRVI